VTNEKILTEPVWEQPEGAFANEALELVYADVSSRLKKDVQQRGGSTLDELLAERVSFIYTHIRSKEAAGAAVALEKAVKKQEASDHVATDQLVVSSGFEHERNYKEAVQLWISLAGQLAASEKKLEFDKVRDAALADVQQAVIEHANTLPDADAAVVLNAMAAASKAADL
jgi:hypothetical protein